MNQLFNLMLKSNKRILHPGLQFSIYVFTYCILLAIIIMFTVDIGEVMVDFDIGNTDINAITYIY